VKFKNNATILNKKTKLKSVKEKDKLEDFRETRKTFASENEVKKNVLIAN
jgi:formiminotetrahydrofolate cyclodeaminase